MLCLCVFTLDFLVPVHSVRMELNVGYSNTRVEKRGTCVVHLWDVEALWVDAEIPLSALIKCQFNVFCCGSVSYRYMEGGFYLIPA